MGYKCACVHTSLRSFMAFLTPLAKIYSIRLKSSDEKGSPCLVDDSKRKA